MAIVQNTLRVRLFIDRRQAAPACLYMAVDHEGKQLRQAQGDASFGEVKVLMIMVGMAVKVAAMPLALPIRHDRDNDD